MAAAIVDGNANSVASTPATTAAGAGGKLRLMCSYGGHIVPRPHDRSLFYLGGETRVVGIDRHITLAGLSASLSRLVGAAAFSIKYQLPYEDLDSLVSVATDDDLEVMIEEYDRIAAAAAVATKPSRRLRLFLFPSKIDPDDGSGNCRRGLSVDDLLGLDDNPIPSSTDAKKKIAGDGHDGQSLPESPLFGTPSSSSSGSSAAFTQSVSGGGSEGQLAQLDVSGQKLDEGLGNAVMTNMCVTENPSQNYGVFSSDDENRTSPKEIYNHGLDSSDQTSKMQTTEQHQYAHANPNLVQFQHHQTTSTPVVPPQSYYPQRPLLQTHLYNPQIPIYFLPVRPNPAYTIPIQHCNSSDATMIHPPDNPNIPLPSPALLPRGISLPSQKPESTTTTGNRSTHVNKLADQNEQYMSCYYQMPQYTSQSPLTANYGYYAQAMPTLLPPQNHTMNSVAITKAVSDPSTTLQQPDLQQPRSSS